MNHKDYVTHINNIEDKDILTRRLFAVNMRLFGTSPQYKQMVLLICEYIKVMVSTTKEGYAAPKGFSGANGGIPFNIIAYMTKQGPQVMINPRITRTDGDMIITMSNCGSLTLPEPIKVKRFEYIDVEYYDMEGSMHKLVKVDRDHYGFTIQHELDHGQGILITDRIA